MTDPHTEQPPKHDTLTDRLRKALHAPINRVASAFVNLGISPNTITLAGFLLATAAALLAAQGMLVQAGIIYAIGAALDGMDGAVARVANKVTRFGALLDSTLDRYGEGVLLTALGYHLARRENWLGLLLTFTALLGSLMVSYLRARSEGLGIHNKVGILTRVERTIVNVLTLLTGQLIPGLAVLAVLTHVTVLQRVWAAYRATRAD